MIVSKNLLIHTFRRPDDGAFIRVKNLNTAIAEITAGHCHEVVLVSVRHFREIFKNDRNTRIFERRLILPILWTNRHLLARTWNGFSSCIAGLILATFLRPDIVVGETSASWKLAKATKFWRQRAKLIMDLHGAGPEEVLFHNPTSKLHESVYSYESRLEQEIALNADFITCQSVNMIEHLIIKYPATRARFHPFQCSVRSELFRMDLDTRSYYRQKLQLNDGETLFVYCGSVHKWQNVHYSVNVFAEYLKCSATAAKLLIMCPNPDAELCNHAYSLGLSDDDFRIIAVPHEEVPAYLNAADIGFLIRDDGVVNRVASPTKLGEYLACGLSVIVGNVANSWSSARLDSSCFCFVDLDNAAGAANTILRFVDSKSDDPMSVKQSATSLAGLSLSTTTETERLKMFMKHSVMEQIS
ncbi:glycosyl transferase group 1 [Geobacter metallireducens RCH3]|uniref:Glycosyltransferase n=1 Tax=Geobacter metallireducens (strain ATCC 53774 / DSM 7210 / GS-15) TaxID=269799 RepID=Q39VJ5_GEOMG|nr:glycosyltransferase [Geobacter metallireducens]ABB31729.1 glycosyltransferase [Geobacter metallireducens GS-15]EHP89393.1 glycosyl transferase group 1 [Geobacter metallireducens RCH3]